MSEETMIIQPKKEKKQQEPVKASANETKSKETNTNKSKGSHAGAVAAGVAGMMAGGAATAAAATMLNNDNENEEFESEQEENNTEQTNPESETQQPASEDHKVEEVKEEPEDIAIHPQDTIPEKDDYVNNAVNDAEDNAHATNTSDDSNDVQILGVYERDVDGVHQEMAVMTDGEDVAAVLDVDGDGEADILAIDEDHSGSFEDNEMHDISGEHVKMDMYEQAYVAQQDDDQAGALLTSDENDYTNHHGANPVSESTSSGDDVQILGVYERDIDGVHQEMAVMTDGEDVAAVIDVDGNGEADIAVIDIDHSQTIEENEVFDISDQHIEMDTYEEAYIAQQEEMDQMEMDYAEMQQQEMEDQDSFAYNASDDQDYNNDVEFYDA